jgi:hypothetical protein
MGKIGAEIIVDSKTNYAVKGLKDVEDGTNRLRKSAEGAGAGAATLSSRMSAMQGALDGANKRLGAVTELLQGGGILAGFTALAGALDEAVQRARAFTAAQQGLKVNLDGARQATGNLVADYDLMVAANKATTLGVTKTSEEFAKLTGVAARLGASVGLDATKAVDDFTTALGRGSVMILDNLGISLKLEDAYKEYGERIGITADKLTDAQKKQAFLTIAMERAEAAANSSGVSFDTNAAKISQLSTAWQNFKDKAALATADAIVAVIDPLSTMNSLVEQANSLWKAAEENSHTLQDRLIAIADKADGATGPLARFVAELGLTNEERKKFDRAAAEEQNLALARERFVVLKQEEEQRQRNMAKAKQERQVAEDALRISKTKADEEARAAAEQAAREAAARAKRDAEVKAARDFDGGFELTAVAVDNIQRAREKTIEQEQQAIALQERKLELLRIEASFATGEDAQVAANDRVYAAELQLLELRERATTETVELFDIQTERQALALNRQLKAQQDAAQKSAKWSGFWAGQMESQLLMVGDAFTAMATAALDGAKTEEFAAAKALQGWAKSVRNQMIALSIKEFALAAANAASPFTAAAAPGHAAAGGIAAAAAVAAGGLAAAVGAALPSEPSSASGLSRGFGGAGGTTNGGGGSPQSTANDSVVPVSRPAEGVTPEPRSGAAAPTAAPFAGATIYVLGATEEQVGIALDKLQAKARRGEGRSAR